MALHTQRCASRTGLQCDCFIVEREKAEEDAANFGCSFVRTYPDGRVEHIPRGQIVIYTRPNTQED